jgi:hypothetical protein
MDDAAELMPRVIGRSRQRLRGLEKASPAKRLRDTTQPQLGAADNEGMSDPKEHQRKSPSATAPQQASPQPEHAPVAEPSPEQVNRMLTKSSRIGAPVVVDLGDMDTGQPSHHSVNVANLDHDMAAIVHIELEGPPSLVVAGKPAQLRPSRDGFVPDQMIDIAFEPTAKGRVVGHLHVNLQWTDGSHEERAIEIRGAAHAFDQPTIAQDEAAQRRSADEKSEAAECARNEAALDRQIHEQEQARDLHVDQGPMHGLEARKGALEAAWKDLYGARSEAVSTVSQEMVKYRRKASPQDDSSVAIKLALAALDIVTVGIAGAIADGVKAAAGDDVPKLLTTLLSSGVKEGIKLGADAAKKGVSSALAAKPAEHVSPPGNEASQDPQAAFFATEVGAVEMGDHANQVSNRVAQRAADALIPTLRTRPERALALMDNAAKAVAKNVDAAKSGQLTSTRSHWLQYLAHTNAGTVEGDSGERVTNTEQLLAPATKRDGIDGVIDVKFRANLARAEEPVEVVGVRLNGVAKGFAEGVFDKHLDVQMPMPLRAIGEASSTNAKLPITVVRDEAGAIRFDDDTAPAGQTSDWLARHAGELHATPGGQLRGARRLVDEIGQTSLKGITMENDDDAKP